MKPIISIQYLRAVAAILVVIYHHVNALRETHAPSIGEFHAGAFGVDIFFVISGFIMWTIAASRPTTPLNFMKRRIIRIAPLYWAITFVTAVVSTKHGFSIDLTPDFVRLFNSLFFLPQWSDQYNLVAPIVLVGWTLNLEMFFYVVFALALFLKPNHRLIVICGVLFLLAASRLIGEAEHPALNLYTESIVIEFGFGVLLGWAYMGGLSDFIEKPRHWLIGVALIAVAIVALAILKGYPQPRGLAWGLPALAICLGTLFLEPLIARRPVGLLKFLGDASYSIYLIHLMAMALGQKFIGAAIAAEAPLVALFAEVCFAVFVGCLAHLLLEKPLTRITQAMFAMDPRTAFERFRLKQW